MKQSFAEILQGLDDDRQRKLRRKLPEWADADAARRAAGLDPLEFPSALSLEQCSSSATARYKAAVAGRAAAGGTLVDLTGGLGVDSWAFSKIFRQVIYYERDPELAAAAGRNFARLGASGIEVRCETVTPDTDLPQAKLVYADPARRGAAGRKVFLLEDCSPDILPLLPKMLDKAPAVLLKLSPMADLTMLAQRLGPALREIHVVEHDGEVKELLCLLTRAAAPTEPTIILARLSGQAVPQQNRSHPWLVNGGTASEAKRWDERSEVLLRRPPARTNQMRFRMAKEREAEAVFASGLQPGETLLEPCPALLKAGAFNLPCTRWGLRKLAPSTHLYTGTPSDPSSPGSLPAFFKAWCIREVLPFGKASFKDIRSRYPQAEVTARNLPLGSDALQKKMGVSPGGDTHIFACRLADGAAVLLVCSRTAI
ncbi:MAG: hypothetical protein K5910_06410 [Bacteroidales bacterium]|nr:hypothetical protein [Bacteroidales bacterium]